MDENRVKEILARIFQGENLLPGDSPKTYYQVKRGAGYAAVFGAALTVGNPDDYQLISKNFDHIKALYDQTPAHLRNIFFDCLEEILKMLQTSKLALIGLLRLGQKERLIKIIEATSDPSSLPISLTGFSEIFHYEYYLFNEAELKRIEKQLYKFLGEMIHLSSPASGWYIKAKESNISIDGIPRVLWIEGDSCDRLQKQIAEAIYKLVTAPLSGQESYDISKDKEKVAGFLVRDGFPTLLSETIEHIDAELRSASTGFHYKGCADKIRSLLETFNLELRDRVAKIRGATFTGDLSSHQEALNFLASKDIMFFSDQARDYCSKLYGLISDESSHSLITPAEYARLFRNMVIEYLFLCLSILAKYK